MPRECRKEDVLNTARRLILAEGHEAVSVRRIASEAGLTTGAIYSNFRNKADILGVLALEAAEKVREMIHSVEDANTEPATLEQWITGYNTFAAEYADYFKLLNSIYESPVLFRALKVHQRDAMSELRRQITTGMGQAAARSGLATPDNAICTGVALLTMLRMMHYASVQHLCNELEVDVQSVEQVVSSMVRKLAG